MWEFYDGIKIKVYELFNFYDRQFHVNTMKAMLNHKTSEEEYAHLLGKMKMYNYQSKEAKSSCFQLLLQIQRLIRL